MQTEEERIRYDRQVRLWGSGVQQRLHSTVLIVDGVAPDETFKNLVLAGVGKVRVVPSSSSSSSAAATTTSSYSLAHSVVALAAASSQNTTFSCVEEAIVAGLRKLNNLVDAKLFDPTESFDSANCVVLMISNPNSKLFASTSSTSSNIPFVADIVLHLRFLSESYAFCEIETRSGIGADTVRQSLWTDESQQPPLVALLTTATRAVQQQHRQRSSSSSDSLSFATLIDLLAKEQPHAVAASPEEQIEAVAAECLPECGGGRPPSVVVNSILGGVLSQQIIAHSCEARGAVVMAAGGQPKPVSWLFVVTSPHIECVMG